VLSERLERNRAERPGREGLEVGGGGHFLGHVVKLSRLRVKMALRGLRRPTMKT
jgi:hypothetical protein